MYKCPECGHPCPFDHTLSHAEDSRLPHRNPVGAYDLPPEWSMVVPPPSTVGTAKTYPAVSKWTVADECLTMIKHVLKDMSMLDNALRQFRNHREEK